MINSVNGKQESMDAVFPLVKKYGGVVVGLALDEDGIPDNATDRIRIAKKIYNEASKYGIEPKDIVIPSEPEYKARIAFGRGPLGEEIEFFQER